MALTPPTYEGRRVILPQCIREMVLSRFPSSTSSSSTYLRESKGPRAVIATPLRRTASMSQLEGIVHHPDAASSEEALSEKLGIANSVKIIQRD